MKRKQTQQKINHELKMYQAYLALINQKKASKLKQLSKSK